MIEITFTVIYVESGMRRAQEELLEELRVFCDQLFNRKSSQYFPSGLDNVSYTLDVEARSNEETNEMFDITVSYSDDKLRKLCFFDQTCPEKRISVEFDDSCELETQVLMPAFQAHPFFAIKSDSTSFDYDDPVKYWHVEAEVIVTGQSLIRPHVSNEDEKEEQDEDVEERRIDAFLGGCSDGDEEHEEQQDDEQEEEEEEEEDITLEILDDWFYLHDISYLTTNLKAEILEFFEMRFNFDKSAIVAVQKTDRAHVFNIVLEREKLYPDLLEDKEHPETANTGLELETAREAYLRDDAITALEDDGKYLDDDWYIIETEPVQFKVNSTSLNLDWKRSDFLRPFQLKKKRSADDSRGDDVDLD